MGTTEDEDIWYPTVDDVVAIHHDIVEEDPDATSGVHDESRVQYAIDYIQDRVGEPTVTIHEKASI